ncbi:MAG: tRNA pseudouridine(55) synthase TruB [Longimicrobiales bacterium]|nr:tRNA pseudouridine(55) synthase TruB [Longimicrobiales bacterium]
MVNGVLLVDKPEGPTSHDVVAVARRALDTRRVGHTGTLDPFATGLLVLCVGPATRLAQYLTGLDKAYEATARLGLATDTLDDTGEVLAESEGWRDRTAAEIRAAFEAQQGALDQRPPAYSAKKVGGKKAYELARAGEAVELEPVPVTIHELDVLALDGPDVRFRMRCSSGTYVRAVARDAGETLGCGAHLTALRRTRVGPFDVESAVAFDALQAAATAAGDGEGGDDEGGAADLRGDLEVALLRPLEAMAHLPRLDLDADQAGRVRHGQTLSVAAPVGVVALAEGDELRAVAESDGRRVRPRKVFA